VFSEVLGFMRNVSCATNVSCFDRVSSLLAIPNVAVILETFRRIDAHASVVSLSRLIIFELGHECRMFETFSFLPPLSDGEIARQVDYIVANGWTPCLEFADIDHAYVQDKSQIRFGNSASAVSTDRAFKRNARCTLSPGYPYESACDTV
jgi:hypothetical protein